MRPHGKVDRFHQRQSGNNDDGMVAGGYTRKELEPQQLFIDLSLLICEARQPELSERGRVQGPHCPRSGVGDGGQQPVAGAAAKPGADGLQNRHVCDETNEKCKRARQIETELRQLWARGIPACLTVLLLPEECSKQDNCMAEALVLEKWTIQQLERRNRDDKLLAGQFLLQAVRSHLHFSQLSAWLIASRGKSPNNVIYRVCLPGESDTSLPTSPSTSSSSSFGISSSSESSASSINMEKHQFPLCSAGKNVSLSVTVESMPRCEIAPSRSCFCLRPSTSGILASGSEEKKADLSTSISAPAAISTQAPSNAKQSYRSQVKEDEIPEVTIEEKEATAEESDTQPSPSDTSRSDSYRSFSDDRPSTPPSSSEPIRPTFGQQLSFVPVSLPPMVSSTSAQLDQRQGHAVCATNPLFDMAAPTPSPSFISTRNLKSRVDALKTEASQLSAKLRNLTSNAPSPGAASSSTSYNGMPAKFLNLPPNASTRSGGKPKFFLADDDDDDEWNMDAQNGQPSRAQDSGLGKGRDAKAARRLAFAEEKAILANDEGTFSEWINQTMDGTGEAMAISGIESGLDSVEDSEETEKEEGCSGVLRQRSFNDKYGRGRNGPAASSSRAEASGHSRRAKRVPTVSTFAAGVQFHPKTGLPLSSSPAPLKRNHSSFNYDPCITSVSALKSALYYYDHESGGSSDSDSGWPLCKSAPASTNLLGSFEESALNGRIKPYGSVDGFTLELGASGAFCPSHVTLGVTTLFFNVSDDNAPSPYFGLCSLENVGRRGYHVPKKGSIQATLFNPQGTVVKMFVVRYDLCDMPPSCQTFVRQRTFFMPSSATLRDAMENRSWLRYLIHLRFASSSSGKLFLHTDIRMLFSRKSELEAYNFNCVDGGAGSINTVDTYELRSFTEMPKDPKFSPRKFSRTDKERYK